MNLCVSLQRAGYRWSCYHGGAGGPRAPASWRRTRRDTIHVLRPRGADRDRGDPLGALLCLAGVRVRCHLRSGVGPGARGEPMGWMTLQNCLGAFPSAARTSPEAPPLRTSLLSRCPSPSRSSLPSPAPLLLLSSKSSTPPSRSSTRGSHPPGSWTHSLFACSLPTWSRVLLGASLNTLHPQADLSPTSFD